MEWSDTRHEGIHCDVLVPTDPQATFTLNQPQLEALGITPCELEILILIARGLSNREIADRLLVSENTVKTHCSRAFDKLGARRRTQAVQPGKQPGLLPQSSFTAGLLEAYKSKFYDEFLDGFRIRDPGDYLPQDGWL